MGPSGGTVSESNATATSNGVFYGVESNTVRPFTSVSGTLGGRLLRVDSRALGRPALDARTGDMTGAMTGPLDFAFRTYTIASEGVVTVFSPNRGPGIVPRTSSEFAVASMNLERLFDTVDDPRTSETRFSHRRPIRTGLYEQREQSAMVWVPPRYRRCRGRKPIGTPGSCARSRKLRSLPARRQRHRWHRCRRAGPPGPCDCAELCAGRKGHPYRQRRAE